MPRELAGFRVSELVPQQGTAYCGHLLAGYGASVTRVDLPGTPNNDVEHTPVMPAYSNGKQSIFLPDGASLGALLDDCDALITSVPPEGLVPYGFDIEEFTRRSIACFLTPLGMTGPWRDYAAHPLNVWHLTGAGLHYFRRPGREPVAPGLNISEFFAGLNAALAIVAARLVQCDTGRGQVIDIAAADCLLAQFAGCPLIAVAASNLGEADKAVWLEPPAALTMPPFPCRDGYFFFFVSEEGHWRTLTAAIDDEVLNSSGLFGGDFVDRSRYLDIINARIELWTRTKTRAELFAICLASHIPGAPLATVAELIHDPTLHRRGILRDIGEAGKHLNVLAGSLHLSVQRTEAAGSEPSVAGTTALRSAVADKSRDDVLAGVRVVNFGQIWAGSLVGQTLAEFGADVVKVETRRRPDLLRRTNPVFAPGHGAYSECTFRSQQSISLNLKSAKGVALARDLVARADVVVENYGPGTMNRLGLGFDELAAINPHVIMLSISPTGRTSAYSEMVAYGSIIDAFAGLHALQGYAGEPPRDFGRASTFTDPGTGIAGAMAVMAALVASRGGTSSAVHIDLGMRDVAVSWLGDEMARYQRTGKLSGPSGNSSALHAPHNLFETAHSEEWVAIAVESDQEWLRLVGVVGSEGLNTALLSADRSLRKQREPEIERWLSAWVSCRTAADVVDMLQAHGVAATPVLSMPSVLKTPHFVEREAFIALGSGDRTGATTGLPWKLSRTPARMRHTTEDIGAHTAGILRDWLGLTHEEIASLERSGALA